MARIYRAEQQPLGRIVALKAMAPTGPGDEAKLFRERFFMEASTCAKLKHPNTVTLFDYGFHKPTGSYFMIMELVDGRTLSQVLKDEGPLHPVRALTFAIEICRSLQEAHQLGIVHRDLKPSNVMVTETVEGETIKVLDFGIAKVLQGNSQSITMEDRIVGSPRYMSPEQISQGKVDGRTDIYALGVLLFELISGRAPYQGMTAIQTLMAHVHKPIPRLSKHVPSTVKIHPSLDDLVYRCMGKENQDRYGSVDQLKQALRQTLAEVADSTEDMHMSTESVVRHALARQPDIPELIHSQPTMERPHTEESTTLTRAAPMMIGLGGLGLAGLGGLALLVGLLVAGWAWMDRAPAPTEGPLPVAGTEIRTFTIVSNPTDAAVYEGGKLLGRTPIAIETNPKQIGPRTYEIQLEGYQSTQIIQQPLATDLTQDVQLKAVPEVVPEPELIIPRPRPPTVVPKPAPGLDVIEER